MQFGSRLADEANKAVQRLGVTEEEETQTAKGTGGETKKKARAAGKKKKKKGGKSKSPSAVLRAAQKLLAAGKFQAASDAAEEVVLDNQEWTKIHEVYLLVGMARAQLMQGEYSLACFYKAMTESDLKILNKKKKEKFQQEVQERVTQAAQHLYRQAMNQGPGGDVELMYSAMVMVEAVGQAEKGKELMQAILKQNPDHPGAALTMGQKESVGGNRPKAAKLLRKGLVRQPHMIGRDISWLMLAAHACIDGSEEPCAGTWLEVFEEIVQMRPIPMASAAKAASSAGAELMRASNAVTDEFRAFGKRAVELGVLMAPLQMPQMLVRGVSATGWVDDAVTWRAVKHLEKHYNTIKKEVMAAYKSGRLSQTASK